MTKQSRVAIYHRTNHLNNTAPLHHLEVYAQERGLEPITFLDIDSGDGQRQSLNHLLNHVRNQKVGIIITPPIHFHVSPERLVKLLSC